MPAEAQAGSGVEPSPESVSDIACLECRRLKRKCDRRYPCDVCSRYSKICSYTVERKGRITRKHVQELEQRIEGLERDLRQRGADLSNVSAADHGIFAPVIADRQSPAQNLHPPWTALSLERKASAPTSTSEALEAQPRNASGYEWHERGQSAKGHDGTASLSLKPDGDGYLGFASAASLFRILQLCCAGGISLAQLDTRIPAAQPDSGYQYTPGQQDLDTCIDAYFNHYHTQYPIIHEATFRAQWNDVLPRPPHPHWDMLLNVVLGLGAFCAFQPMYVVDHFLESCIKRLSVETLESGSLTLVATYCLLSNLSQKRNKPNSGSVYLGIAVRMAIGLGLHRELPAWNITPFEREMRRRTWWIVYMFDAGAAITFGRPILLPSDDADVNLPINVHDRTFTPSANRTPLPVTQPTIYCTVLYQNTLHLTSQRIYQRVLSSSPPSLQEIAEMDAELVAWLGHLPDWMTIASITPDQPQWLQFSVHKLFWRYCNLRIILHRRAFLERALTGKPLVANSDLGLVGSDPDSSSALSCLRASMDTIDAVRDFFQVEPPSRLQTWYGLHFLFHASFVPLIALKMDVASSARLLWSNSVYQARDVLQILAPHEVLAEKFLKLLSLVDDFPTGSLSSTLLNGDMATEAGTEKLWAGLTGGNAAWSEIFGEEPSNLAQTLVPFADLTTLNSFWSSNPGN